MDISFRRRFKGMAVVAMVLIASACNSGESGRSPASNEPSAGGPSDPGGPVGSGGKINVPPGTLEICSPLNFKNVAWPSALTVTDQQALELALNISGSFEGADGWANLTNNFDGQGLSMGLLNQTLGTGSLQPLLIKMRDQFPAVLETIFDSARLQSLLGMLAQWESDSAQIQPAGEFSLSFMDFPVGDLALSAMSANQRSVIWAVKNLYHGTAFEPHWQKELMALGNTPEYISIQINAALWLHSHALAEEKQSGVMELRSYLFMFDINVQDGGMYSEDFDDYQAYLESHSDAGDTDRLMELMALRLRHIQPQYVEDVRSRKQTIIDGAGAVHGEFRDLPSEYCYNSLFSYH